MNEECGLLYQESNSEKKEKKWHPSRLWVCSSLVVSAKDSGLSSLSSRSRVAVLCSWAREFTGLLSQLRVRVNSESESNPSLSQVTESLVSGLFITKI